MKTGDLIFSFIGLEDNAISAVTVGYRGARVNHMGVVIASGTNVSILEAYPPDVGLTDLDVFLARSEGLEKAPRCMFGRVIQQYETLVKNAVSYGLKQRDVPYDYRYLTDQAALYCSELVVDMFKYANKGNEFFPEVPMSFRDKSTQEILPFWIDYYARLGMKVPSGEPGSNPGAISLDPKVEIYSVVGDIPGYQ